MKLKMCSNHSIIIKGKGTDDFDWQESINEIRLPSKILFMTTGELKEADYVKKISWDFGDNTKTITVTDRKVEPHKTHIQHLYKKAPAEIQTLSVQASVYTPSAIYITPIFVIHSIGFKVTYNYIDPAVFKQQIIQYYDDNIMSSELADSVQKIATRLAFASNFINYTYREEMTGDALIKMLEALRGHKYIPHKGNPFSYFTKIAFHAFCNRIKKEKKARKALEELQNETYERLLGDKVIPYQGVHHTAYDVTENNETGETVE